MIWCKGTCPLVIVMYCILLCVICKGIVTSGMACLVSLWVYVGMKVQETVMFIGRCILLQ